MQEAETSYPAASERQIFNEALRRTLDRLVTGLIEGTRAAALEAGVENAAQVRDCPERLASLSPEAAEASKQLKQLLSREVYQSPELNQERRRTDQKVIDLFQFYISHPERLPASFQKQAGVDPLHRVVCDYIAGMTDKYLLHQHKEFLSA